MREPEDIQRIFRNFLDNSCTAQEFERLKTYIRQPEAAEYIRDMVDNHAIEIQSLEDKRREEDVHVQRRYKRLLTKIEDLDNAYHHTANPGRNIHYDFKNSKQQKSSSPKKYALAAVLLLLFVSGFFTWYMQHSVVDINMIEKITQKGQKSTLMLSDGTEIRLNADSKLVFPEHFSGNTREVTLVGEAFFSVAPNESKPFIVKTASLTTTVLGTTFNISAFQNENTAITVATGKVKVERNDLQDQEWKHSSSSNVIGQVRSPEILTANQQVVYHLATGDLIKQEIDVDTHLAWTNGTIIFDKTTVAAAISNLERWYNVTFEYDSTAFKNCTFSAQYKNESLKNILESFRHILNTSYTITEDRTVVLKGAGCGDEFKNQK